jgi:CelD/BcsL family acetyltransferase involved in cellulose biosynthesis
VAVSAHRIRETCWRAMEAPGARREWDALAACASEPNPFFESWYLLPSLRSLDPVGSVQLLRFECDGRLAGLLPLVRDRRYYRWPIPHMRSWVHANCFLGAPLVAAGKEQAFWQALLDWADANAGIGLFLHLSHMPLDGPLHDALTQVLTQQNRTAALVHREDRALLRSSLSADAYLEAALSAKKRKELRRQHNRLSELGALQFERQMGGEALSEWIDSFLALEHSGWKGAGASALASNPVTQQMFRDALTGGAAQGKLERLSLSLDGRPLAMLVNFLSPPGAFSFKTAFDERYARYSPGVLIQRENLAMLEHPQIRWFDSCAAAEHPMIDHLWRTRRPIGRLSIAIGSTLRRRLFQALTRAELGRRPAGVLR